MQLDAAGNPAVVFGDSTSIYLVRCNDPACSGTDDIARIIAFGATNPALALDSAGLPVITYFDSANLDLVLVRCNDPECRDEDETYQVLETPDSAVISTIWCSMRWIDPWSPSKTGPTVISA
jgi:hypothetical protein